MLKREENNKILKTVKTVIFAANISLLNPIDLNAAELNQKLIESETKNNILEDTIFYASIGMIFVSGTWIFHIINKEIKKYEKIEYKKIKNKNYTKSKNK